MFEEGMLIKITGDDSDNTSSLDGMFGIVMEVRDNDLKVKTNTAFWQSEWFIWKRNATVAGNRGGDYEQYL